MVNFLKRRTAVPRLRGDLLAQDLLQGDRIRRELGDTLTQLLHGHLLLVEVEAEQRLVVQVRPLGDVQLGRRGGVQLLGNGVLRVVQLLEQSGLVVR